jgi:hypothetical protein
MPILTTFEIKGDADELLEMKQSKLDPISRELAPRHGALAHMVIKTDTGLKVFNVWETLEGSEAMAKEFQAKAAELGIERRPENWEHWDLAQFVSMKEVMPVG